MTLSENAVYGSSIEREVAETVKTSAKSKKSTSCGQRHQCIDISVVSVLLVEAKSKRDTKPSVLEEHPQNVIDCFQYQGKPIYHIS